MIRALAALVLLATLSPAEENPADAVLAHDHHPGLGHPEEGEGEHHHGDPDDHHESPDSPCHHHDDHTCCNAGQALGLPSASAGFEKHILGFLAIPCLEPSVPPVARELFHVPLG
ncbi:MAG TPA: hypothetical protein VF950_28765 [Planctomycetota bacterium]